MDRSSPSPASPTKRIDLGQTRTDLLSGFTVALALVPEAVAFAFVAHVNPLIALYAAFIVCLITAAFGGRPGMISGATGALAVVMVNLVVEHGVEYLFATVVLMGILQILAGVFRLGKFIRMVPYPVMLGFVNGLAIVIFLAQLNQFKFTDAAGAVHWLSGSRLWIMLGLVALTMAVIVITPKITKIVPAPLVAIALVTAIVLGFDLPIPRVGDMAHISGGLPSFHIPMVPLTWHSLTIIVPYAVILAAVGLIESLLTLNLVNDILESRGGASKECVAQGMANVVTGFFGGMGGCAMIGQSMINVTSGGRGRLSGLSAGVFLLAFILVAAPLIELIPLAALVGVMFMVVIGTFAWSSLRILHRIPRTDAFVLVLVSAITVFSDLAIAVVAGVIVSALSFAWKVSQRVETKTYIDADGTKIYALSGPLFFGSVSSFNTLFDPHNDPQDVIIDFMDSRVADHSGLKAIDGVADRYLAAGKNLHLRHLSADCIHLLKKAGPLCEVSVLDDPLYGVAADYDKAVSTAH